MSKKTKNTKIQDSFQKMSLKALDELLKKTEDEWFQLKIDLKLDKVKDVHQPRKTRKKIARIKTAINKKKKEEKQK